MSEDLRWMHHAFALAGQARAAGEVPIGACVVKDGVLVSEGYNRPISSNDPTAHAEIVALRAAALALGTYRLVGATLYVTLEPCAMCAGAMVHARIARLVFGADDPRAGAVDHGVRLFDSPNTHHHPEVISGIGERRASELLKAFFEGLRK